MTDRSGLMRTIREASDAGGQPLARAIAALEDFDRAQRDRAALDRETDLGARIAGQRLTPVPIHEHHTAATDWLAEASEPALDYRTAMIAEATTWYRGLPAELRADAEELGVQADGRARTLASGYGRRMGAARSEFLQVVAYLHSREGASGLPQIDQTIDPNNQPAATPYPTEVFPTFGADQDPFNQTEGFNHDSQASSERAPLIQQVMQQQNGGSGFGTGPERPDSHTTQFDTADSYAEVPLGPPGTLPTAPAATDSAASSAPNPVAGVPQDAGAERRVAVMHGYSAPDPFGYRWGMSTEVMHPFHGRCSSAHWPDEACGDFSHTASVAVGYTMDIDQARQAARCEAVGVREGLRAITASHSAAELGEAHNRFTAAWGGSERTLADTAVLHGFMAVVRPVLAELVCTACKGTDCDDCTNPDCACARHPRGHARMGARSAAGHGELVGYVNDMAREYRAAPAGE